MKLPPEQPAVLMNLFMPSGVVIPMLAYPDVRESVEWLCGEFGFVERLRIENHRAQLSFGAGSVVVTKQPGALGASSYEVSDPHLLSASWYSQSVMVHVADVECHYERTK